VTRRVSVRHRLAGGGLVLMVLAAAGGLAGCTSARNTLGTPVNACYQALPVAAAAVHHRGHFAGVVLLGRRALRSDRRVGAVLTDIGGSLPRSVCVVSFHGRFAAGDVERPIGTSVANGRWALVLVALPSKDLVGTVVSRRPPHMHGDLF
jgi:hypothetical protein